MSDIQVGEYVRSENGIIGKVVGTKEYNDNCYPEGIWLDDGCHYYDDEIVKHSPNIIDLIEERRLCKWR